MAGTDGIRQGDLGHNKEAEGRDATEDDYRMDNIMPDYIWEEMGRFKWLRRKVLLNG